MKIEFYIRKAGGAQYARGVQASAVPRVGEYVSLNDDDAAREVYMVDWMFDSVGRMSARVTLR